MFRGLASIIYKETFHVLRDPRTLFLMVLVPSMDLTMFGYAIDLDVKHIGTAIYCLDGRQAARDLVDTFQNTGTFRIKEFVNSDREMRDAIVRGRVKVAVKIPPDYSDAILAGRSAKVQVLLDGSDSNVAMQALNVAQAIGLRESLQIVARDIGAQGELPVEMRTRVLFNPDMKTPNFMVPALVAVVMQAVTMILTAFAIVREKENGTLEQLMVTPVSRLGLMLGKLAPYAVIGAFDASMCVFIMHFLFGVPIAGNVALLAGFSTIFLFASLGLGLLVSTIAANQMQAVQLAFVFILPTVMLSGFMFPQEQMPTPIYLLGQIIPATYFIRILRGIILRGAGFADLWPQALCLAFMGVGIIAIASSRFRKTLT